MLSFKPHFVLTNPMGVYLRRWFLTPWSSDDHPMKPRRLPNAYLHNMQQSDDDRALHCHPWDNLSIVLWGGYIEHVFAYPPVEGMPLPPVIKKRRRMGSIVYRKAELAHRLELYRVCGIDGPGSVNDLFYGENKHCWTIFITWRKRREWGFWTERNGIVGSSNHQVGKEKYLQLQYPGKVAQWVHYKLFGKAGGQ